jgi:hypothetical protein
VSQTPWTVGLDGRTSRHIAMQEMRHQRLIQLLITGYSLKEAAAELKIGYYAAKQTARQPQFILDIRAKSEEIGRRLAEEMASTTLEMAQKLEEASAMALEEMVKMMGEIEGPNRLKMNICQDLLDRDPKSSRTKRLDVTGSMDHSFITPAFLIHAAATAREIGRPIDVDPDPGHTEDSGKREG